MTHRQGEPSGKRRRHLRAKIAARDGWACFYCGMPFAFPGAATLDHLVPFEAFPTWCQANLVLACSACNHAKGNTLPQAFLRPFRYAPGLRTTRWGHLRAAVRELYAALRIPPHRVSHCVTARSRETAFPPVQEHHRETPYPRSGNTGNGPGNTTGNNGGNADRNTAGNAVRRAPGTRTTLGTAARTGDENDTRNEIARAGGLCVPAGGAAA